MLDHAVQEAGTSSRYVDWISEAPETQYNGLEMSVTQKFGTWCDNKLSKLKHFALYCGEHSGVGRAVQGRI